MLSSEHRQVGLFERRDVATLRMPDGYQRSTETWYATLAGSRVT